jgi:filamentous hemagglutinin family protein
MKAHKYLATSIATLLATMSAQRAHALPQGEAVAHGKASFKRDGGRMEIRASDRAVINFRGFNIDRKEAVTFVQPGSKSRVLNRVTDGNPTRVFGQLKANGQVVLVNPSGVFFENGSMVNVGGIIAAAGKISDVDFIAGRNRFTELTGEVSNAGTIRATGDVSLVGAHVSNSGIIQSGRGMVSMVAGDEVLVGERGGNVYVSGAATPGKAAKAGVKNTGKITAKKALLGVGDFYSLAVQHSGEIRAEEVAVRGGKGGRVEVSGKIDVSARGKGKKGGRIEVTGETVALTGAKLDASGNKGGGEVLVGGDWQGGGTVNRAQTTTVDAATLIQADALKRGAGGKVVVWADGATQFDGQITARGAGAGQLGGQVETSGKLTLGAGQTARVDASSPGGKMGNWLLDPTDLTIAAGGGGTIGGAGNQTVDASVINAAAATVILTATNNITFAQSIAMTKAGAGLTATAGRNIEVNGGFTITTNNGEINFTADSDKNGTGFIQLGVGSQLKTKGAGVNLTVDHGSAASTDGIKIFGNIDTRTPSAGVGMPAGVGKLSTFQLKGSAQTGAIEVGAVTLNAGHEEGADRDKPGSFGQFDLFADEIDLTGPAGSVKGSGHLNLRPSSLTTGMKILAANNTTAGQLDITQAELDAISSDRIDGFAGVRFGRTLGENGIQYTGTLEIGTTGGAPLVINRGGGGESYLGFESGPNGIVANVKIEAQQTDVVQFRGGKISLNHGILASDAIVSFIPINNDNVEVLNMAANPATSPGILRLDNTMLEGVGNTSRGLEIGWQHTSRSSTLTFQDAVELDPSAKGGRVIVSCGGTVKFDAHIDASNKLLQIKAGNIEFNNNTSSLIKGTGGLTIMPSQSDDFSNSTRSLEVYATGSTPQLSDALTIQSGHLENLASNFTGHLTLGAKGANIGGDVVINAALNLSGKTIAGLILTTPETVQVNQPITMGTQGTSGVKQSLELNGQEVEIGAALTGAGVLTIAPVSNTFRPENPLERGMLIGAATDNANHLTITEAEYARIGNGFSRIVFGVSSMGGDLEVAGFAGTQAFKLKADTVLSAKSTVKINAPTGGVAAGVAGNKALVVRALELDITRDVTNLSALQVHFPTGAVSQESGREFQLNRDASLPTTKPVDPVMDLNSSDLSFIRSSVLLFQIGGQPIGASATDTSAAMIRVVAPMTLPTHTTLQSTTGQINIGDSIDGNFNLTLNTAGQTLLAKSLGATTPLASLSITKSADITGFVQKTVIGSADGAPVIIRTTGNQTYSESVELLSGGTLEAGGTLTVSETLTAGANDLALLADEMVLSGAAGTITGTRGLQLGTGKPGTNMAFNATTSVAGQLNLTQAKLNAIELSGFNKLTLGRADGTGTLSVKDNFGLLQETVIQTGGGALTIEKQINGAQKLTLSSGNGAIEAKAALGATTALGDLLVLSAGTATFLGAVNAASVFTDAGGTTVLTGGMSNSQGALSVYGAAALTAGTVTTTGIQDYNDQVVLGAATTLTSTGAGDININAGATGPFALNINTIGVTRLKSTVTVASVETNVGGSVELAANITTTGTQQYHEQAVLSGNTQLTGTTVTFGEALAGGGFGLSVTGDAQFAKDLTSLSTLAVTGSSLLNGGLVSTSGAQTYGGNVTLGKDTTLTSTAAGNIALNAGASGGFALNINTSGTTSLAGTINVGSITTDAGGTVELPGLVTTSGAQTYNDAAVLGAATTLTSTGGGLVGLHGGASGAYDLTINTAGVTTLGSGINVATITTDAAGSVALSGAITTTGAQTYNDAATLTGATTLTSSSSGNVSLQHGVTGPFDLAVNTSGVTQLGGGISVASIITDAGGTVELGGTITTSGAQTYNENAVLTGATTLTSTGGGTVGLQSGVNGPYDLTVNTSGTTQLGGTVSLGSITTDAGGTVELAGTVTTTGAQTYGDAAVLGSATTLTSSGGAAVALNGGASGAYDLTINTAGVTALGGGINVASITTDAAGSVALSGAIKTTGAQTYNDAATLTGATTVSSTGGGALSLKSGATGAFDLALNTSGTTQLSGGISVAGLSTDAGGVTEIKGDVTTTGAQTYGDAVQVSGPVALSSTSGGALTLGAGVDGAGSVSLATSGNVIVSGDSGTSGALQDFRATGARVEVGGVQATGDVTLDANDLLVLQGASYKAGGALSLNPTERATASGRSSIVKPSGDVAFEGDKFVMGAGQKLVVSNGALSITAASGVVGDLAASVAMDLNVDQLEVLARDAGDFSNAGLSDAGLSMVSPSITFNGTLSFSPDSTGAKRVFWNTANGVVAGKNNVTSVPGSGVAKNPALAKQFNSVDAGGYVLQPLAVKPAVVVPPVIVDPVVPPLVIPEEQARGVKAFVRPVQFDLMNWSLGYRDETMERPDGIWVIRSLGINGRWDNLGRILAGEKSEPKKFLEL